jgi:hypothetical protein
MMAYIPKKSGPYKKKRYYLDENVVDCATIYPTKAWINRS